MYKLTKEQRKALLEYLYSRPYKEVVAGVSMLENLEEIKKEK